VPDKTGAACQMKSPAHDKSGADQVKKRAFSPAVQNKTAAGGSFIL